jgi:excisionase family DNA binding protein
MTPEQERVRVAVEQLVAALVAAARAGAAPEADAPERLHDLRSAAARLSVGRSFLYDEIAAGRLQTLKCGRRRLVAESAIRDYIASRATPPTNRTQGRARS